MAFNELSEIQPHMFEGLTALRIISLDGNMIHNIFPGAFRDLQSLTTLILSENHLSEIRGDVDWVDFSEEYCVVRK